MPSIMKLVLAVTVIPLAVTKVFMRTKRIIKIHTGIEGTSALSHRPVNPYRSAGTRR